MVQSKWMSELNAVGSAEIEPSGWSQRGLWSLNPWDIHQALCHHGYFYWHFTRHLGKGSEQERQDERKGKRKEMDTGKRGNSLILFGQFPAGRKQGTEISKGKIKWKRNGRWHKSSQRTDRRTHCQRPPSPLQVTTKKSTVFPNKWLQINCFERPVGNIHKWSWLSMRQEWMLEIMWTQEYISHIKGWPTPSFRGLLNC